MRCSEENERLENEENNDEDFYHVIYLNADTVIKTCLISKIQITKTIRTLDLRSSS